MLCGIRVLKWPVGGSSYGHAPTNVFPPVVAAAAAVVGVAWAAGAVVGATVGAAAAGAAAVVGVTLTAGRAGCATVVGGAEDAAVGAAGGAAGAPPPQAASSAEASAVPPSPKITRRRDTRADARRPNALSAEESCRWSIELKPPLPFRRTTSNDAPPWSPPPFVGEGVGGGGRHRENRCTNTTTSPRNTRPMISVKTV